MDRPAPVLRLEGAVKYGEVLILEPRCSLDRLVLVDVAHDPIRRFLPIAETTQRLGPIKVVEHVRPVIGDVVVAMAGRATVVDSRTQTPASLDLVGVHGSLTRHEMLVPCVVVA